MNSYTFARNLAATSLGLGLAELLAPRQVARLIGVSDDHVRLLQALGLREIASGLGILQGRPAWFLWSRVGGDLMDLALLAAAHKSERSDRRRVTIAMAAVAGVTVLDLLAAALHSRDYGEPEWRDQRSMEERSGFAVDAQGPFEALPESTATEERTETSPQESLHP